ncbi:amino acid ABC transporter ATP-binding protein [Gluconacetobacter entanii]|uniref:Glutamine ABC transporter ATP-binding protein n=1 Tax=Gluconacetobacter entanii TaxID=108528 RepID=A0A318Q5M5_9PROT|nr:amino acid ABC transporter ATP-binding protein [Gluconacetobacter entanii]PYD64253.1 glutamine ABC transporter ATP-binding protein [Gluconacetobacter entanii]
MNGNPAAMGEDASIVVAARGLCRNRGEMSLLDTIDLEIRKGEKVAVLGPSGAGKSTLIRCFNRTEAHDSGILSINGQVIDETTDLVKLRGMVGLVFQNYHLFPHLSVLDNCTLAPRLVRNMSPAQARTLALGFLEQVGIREQAERYPAQLSGGQQQRVAIARALCMQPQIMMFDEPTAALDPESIRGVMAIINDLCDAGITSIFVTHEMGFARHVADRIIFMDRGRILESAPATSFFQSPRSTRARMFLDRMLGP